MRALRFGSETFTLSPTELYEAAQASSSGMTKMLHGLTEAKLVVRIDNPNDARSTLVRLTSKGADMVETIVDELIKVNTALLDGVLSPSESEQLATLLNTLSQRLQEKKQAQKLEK